jgi:prepilin-type N-terminal cleavage/methylation domain-containing protein
MTKSSNQHGFTILELMIATMVFSVIFLSTTTAILQISKLYYKGVVTGRTQEVARGITDQISQQLQLGTGELIFAADATQVVAGGNDVTVGGNKLTVQAFCIGSSRYTYRLNTQVDKAVANHTYDAANSRLAHALWRDTVSPGTCVPADLSANSAVPTGNQPPPSWGGEELLGQGMRLTQLTPKCDASTKVCTLDIGVIYGDNDLITPDPAVINDPQTVANMNTIKTLKCESIIGNHWCAASQFSTSVVKRLGDN